MTLELNIFHLCKRHLHPEEEEGLEEVCLINTLVEEHCDKNLEESLNENLEVLEEGLPEPSDVLAIMSPWRRKEEILPLFNEEDLKGVAREDPPKLVLKSSKYNRNIISSFYNKIHIKNNKIHWIVEFVNLNQDIFDHPSWNLH